MSEQIPVGHSGTDRWLHFFQNLAAGMIPYLQLFASRSMKGAGLGNIRPRRFQIPVSGPGSSSQLGGHGPPGIKVITQAQSGVERARALVKEGEDQSKDMRELLLTTKSKPARSRIQKRTRSRRGNTSVKNKKKKKATSKAPSSRRKKTAKGAKALKDVLS